MPTETRPMKCDTNWPLIHLNGGTAKSTTLLNASGGRSSHWITGYQLDGTLIKDEGFHLLRRACVHINGADTWTVPDVNIFDWAADSDGSDGHFALEIWVYIPSAGGAVAGLIKRGSVTDGWVLSVDANGLVTFTVDDTTGDTLTITSTSSVHDGWHLITVTCIRDSLTGLNLYIDGVSDATAKTTKDLDGAVEGGTTIVVTGEATDDLWLGPVGIYEGSSADLSAATVLANYNEGIGRKYDGSETGLVAAWNNDEGTGVLCYDILNNDSVKATISVNLWSPTKQSGATAAIKKCGPPFRKQYEDDAINPLATVGRFGTATVIGTTDNVIPPVVVSFPQAIKIGRNNPVRILETNGAFSLILHGFTADA
ncbi:hypothetical protein LCGC14_1766600 [marine sediment metagenome]|uniref:LamG-like jellyroll fold domain-containing protein n=1 Tax=marine sediment metagenome TaxID=412755 RepID=A0A0F9GZH2_9ZZZZ